MNNEGLNKVGLTAYQAEAIDYLIEKLQFSDIDRRVSPVYDPYEVQDALRVLSSNL